MSKSFTFAGTTGNNDGEDPIRTAIESAGDVGEFHIYFVPDGRGDAVIWTENDLSIPDAVEQTKEEILELYPVEQHPNLSDEFWELLGEL